MEDKTFGLVTQLYAGMTKQLDVMNRRFEAIDQKLDRKVDSSDIVRLENVLVPKVDALLDGFKLLSEKQDEICTSITNLHTKAMQHEVQIAALHAAS